MLTGNGAVNLFFVFYSAVYKVTILLLPSPEDQFDAPSCAKLTFFPLNFVREDELLLKYPFLSKVKLSSFKI